MADATKLPKITELAIFQWARPDSPNPKLASPITSKTQTTLRFSHPPLDKNGDVIAADFIMSVLNSDNYTENILVRVANLSADGLTATSVVRGIAPTGIDWETGSANFAALHDVDSPIACSVTAVGQIMLISAMQGTIATGGNDITIGDATANNATLNALIDSGETGIVRLNQGTGKGQFQNVGGVWTNFDDVSASVLVKVSANDTTPSYLGSKMVAGDNVTIVETDDGANETLVITANSQREGVTTHATYTPAFLTGGTSAESNVAIWDSVSDGEFAITIDGVAREITGLDFTAPVTDMDEVAAVIQAGIRAATGSTETCVWDTNHFVVTSADTTASSAITVTSTVAVPAGTDISGAGGSVYMDAETGRGTVTNAALNPAADVGKVGLLNASGEFEKELLPSGILPGVGYTAKGEIIVANAADTPGLLSAGNNNEVLTVDSSEPTGLKYSTTSGLIETILTPVVVSNTTTETDLISISIPAGSLGTNKLVRGHLNLRGFGCLSSSNYTFRLKYGSTTIGSVSTTPANTISSINGILSFNLYANASTTAQQGTLNFDGSEVDGWQTNSSSVFVVHTDLVGTSTENSATDLNLVISVQFSAASTSNRVTMQNGHVEKVA